MKHVMRHFSLAMHRFESWTGPRRAYACCLHAVALLLADIAGDSRRPAAERRRAEECLDAMMPQDLLEVGLSCDFREICVRCSRNTPLYPLLLLLYPFPPSLPPERARERGVDILFFFCATRFYSYSSHCHYSFGIIIGRSYYHHSQ